MSVARLLQVSATVAARALEALAAGVVGTVFLVRAIRTVLLAVAPHLLAVGTSVTALERTDERRRTPLLVRPVRTVVETVATLLVGKAFVPCKSFSLKLKLCLVYQ